MAIYVNSNLASLQAQYSLNQTSDAIQKSLQQLSTGSKLNSGADGPAALVLSEHQLSQIAGLQTAINNTSQAVDLVQTGEGALNEINTLLTQARGLALNSANEGVNDTNSLAGNQAQLANIISTINTIAQTTQFGGRNLLDGTAGLTANAVPAGVTISGGSGVTSGTYTISALTAPTKTNLTGGSVTSGVTSGDSGSITINGVNITLNSGDSLSTVEHNINLQSNATGVTASDDGSGHLILASNTFGPNGAVAVSVTTAAGSTNDVGTDLGITAGYTNLVTPANGGTVTVQPAGITTGGAGSITLTDSHNNNYNGTFTGNTASFSTGPVTGLNVTLAASGSTSTVSPLNQTLTLVNDSLVFQIGANAGSDQQATVSFSNANTNALGQNATGLVTASYTSLATINIGTTNASDAQDAIRVIDKAVNDITNERGTLGAFQENTLQANAQSLQVALQNTQAAESTIANTDFAATIAQYTQQQVQLQAGATVLSNSNQITQLITQLLRGQ